MFDSSSWMQCLHQDKTGGNGWEVSGISVATATSPLWEQSLKSDPSLPSQEGFPPYLGRPPFPQREGRPSFSGWDTFLHWAGGVRFERPADISKSRLWSTWSTCWIYKTSNSTSEIQIWSPLCTQTFSQFTLIMLLPWRSPSTMFVKKKPSCIYIYP